MPDLQDSMFSVDDNDVINDDNDYHLVLSCYLMINSDEWVSLLLLLLLLLLMV